MSVSSRLISGTTASWVQIGITLVTQLTLVPLYLSYWDVTTYGLWLAVLSLSALLTSLDLGFQEYIGFEFLRFGKKNLPELSKYLCSGLIIGIGMGIIQLLLISACLFFGNIGSFLGEESTVKHAQLIHEAGLVLLMQSFAWLICGSIGGILTRALSTFGHYHRMAWWGVFSALLMNVAPAVAVIFGASLLETGLIVAGVRILADIPIYIDMIRLLRKEGIVNTSPSIKLGWNIFIKSILLSVTGLCENLRQQGARLLLTPFTGAAGLAAFSTMRTGTNVAMQGLHTITNPLMPELMLFLHNRDQERSDKAFGTVWIVSISLLTPALVCAQVIVEPLYEAWTRGRIPFNPWLFAALSVSVLVYAIAQPAIAIVRGNNLLNAQLLISGLTATIALTGIFLLVPWLGITGAGVALLLAEIAANIGFRMVARRWLRKNELIWPEQAFYMSATSVGIAAAAMVLIILLPTYKWALLTLSMLLLLWNCWRYWQVLPLLSTSRAKHIIGSLPVVRFLFPR